MEENNEKIITDDFSNSSYNHDDGRMPNNPGRQQYH
jgi:hypothetical protein